MAASATLRIYDAGAEGYNSFEPFQIHDVLANSWYGYDIDTTTYAGATWPGLEIIPEVGCIRPRLLRAPTDNTLADWDCTGGQWGVNDLEGSAPAQLIWQKSTEVDEEWTATTVEDLPADSRFELYLWAYDTPAGQDWTNYPPYVYVQYGNYRIYIADQGEASFQRYVDSAWWNIGCLNLDIMSKPCVLWWDPLAGGISFSTDYGKTRTLFSCTPDVGVTNISIPTGTLTVGGCGRAMFIGLSALEATDNLWMQSTSIGTYESRADSWTVDTNTWARKPSGTTITGTDLSGSVGPGFTMYKAQFGVDCLTAEGVDNDSFIDVYRIPELYAVDVYQAATQVAALDWESAFNYVSFDNLRSFTIDHTPEGGWTAAQVCTIEAPWSPFKSFTVDCRFKFARLFVDDYHGGGETCVFCGLIINWSFVEGKDGERLHLELVNSAFFRAQRVLQEKHWWRLGGLTDTNAYANWTKHIGLPTGRGSWVTTGNTIPQGSPAEPFLAPYEGVEALDLLNRLNDYTGCLTYFSATDGIMYGLLRSAYNTVGSTVMFYKGADEADAAVSNKWQTWDNLKISDEGAWDLATRFKAVGRVPLGTDVYYQGYGLNVMDRGYLTIDYRATDWAAERQTAAWNFVGFPMLNMIPGEFVSVDMAKLAALSMFDTRNKAWRKCTFRSPGRKESVPPMWAYIDGADQIANTDPIRVLGLRHIFELGEFWTEYEGVILAE